MEGILPYESARRYVMWTRQWGFLLLMVLVFTRASSWIIMPFYYLIMKILT